MNASMVKTTVRKALAVLVVAVLATGIAFASTLSPVGDVKDAKVYDLSGKLTQNVSEVSDGWTIRTFTSDVTFTSDNISLEVGGDSLLQVISLADKAVEIYLLDGNVIATTYNTDVVLRTTVTSYNVKAGSTVFVVSDDTTESVYIEVGSATADNLITNASTQVPEGTYVDNSQCNFQPEATTKEAFAATARPQAQPVQTQEEVVETVQPAEEAPAAEPQIQVSEDGALVKTLEYYGFTATIKAYTGMAYVQYPAFVTDQELEAAAAAAYWKYADLLDGVYFYIQDEGLAVVTYPDYYGPAEFSYAMELLEVELPAYLNELFGIEEQPVAQPEAVVVEEVEVVEVQEEVAEVEVVVEEPVAEEPAPAEEVVEEVKQPVAEEPVKTPLETVTKEQATAAAQKEKNVTFGADVSVVYGAAQAGKKYNGLAAADDRIGTYPSSIRVSVDPYVKAGDFAFGLHFSVDPLDLAGSFSFNTDNGVTGYASSVMSFISKVSYESDAVSLNIDRKQEVEFTSPVFRTLNRAYAGADNLTATIAVNKDTFSMYAFADDIQFSNKLAARDQFMGARAAFTFKSIEIGASAVANVGQSLRGAKVYPAIDVSVPVAIKDTTVTFSAGAALQAQLNKLSKMDSAMVKANMDITKGAFSVGLGAAYSTGAHFVDAVNNAPVTVTSQFSGKAIDVLLSAAVNTKHFSLSGSLNAPMALEGGSKLVYNKVKTSNGSSIQLSADILTVQAQLMLGKFTFTAGTIYNGLAGRIVSGAKGVLSGSGLRAAVTGVIDPAICTYYAVADFKAGFLDVYGKAEYAVENGSITLPLSVGVTLTF